MRVQLGKRAIAAVLVLGVRGVVYVLRLVLGFQPHRSGLKERKICVRIQRFEGSIGSKSPLRGGRKKVEKKHFSQARFSELGTGHGLSDHQNFRVRMSFHDVYMKALPAYGFSSCSVTRF